MKSPWPFILSRFVILRTITLIGAVLGYYFLSFEPSYPYWDAVLEKFGHPLFWSWASFDGVHYILLSEHGYQFALVQAFFPFYFLFIRFLNLAINNRLLAGLLISHLFFIGVLWMGYKLMRLDLNKNETKKALTFLALFPTSFYFLSVYTESLFLFLLFATFYFIRTKRWLLAGVFGILLTLTRFVGIFIVPAFIYEIWLYNQQKPLFSKIKQHLSTLLSKFSLQQKSQQLINIVINNAQYLYALIPCLGLLAYMIFLKINFGDPFLFINVQSGFGAGRQTEKLVLLYQVFWRYLKMIATVNTHSFLYYTVWLELSSTLLVLSLLAWAFLKKIRISYLIYAIPACILPTLTGTFSSMPRYVLIAFPAFMVLSKIENPAIRFTVYAVFSIVLIISTALFTRGYWVA